MLVGWFLCFCLSMAGFFPDFSSFGGRTSTPTHHHPCRGLLPGPWPLDRYLAGASHRFGGRCCDGALLDRWSWAAEGLEWSDGCDLFDRQPLQHELLRCRFLTAHDKATWLVDVMLVQGDGNEDDIKLEGTC